MPIFIALRSLRCSHEADWSLHIHTVKLMLPYSAAAAAAGHRHYLCYATGYLISVKMIKLPSELLHKFLTGDHAMRHCNGLWNFIWSDMMIETTVMRYGYVPGGIIGITLNESALERYARSLYVSSVLEQSPPGLKRNETNKNVTQHKEESKAWMKIDSIDRDKLWKNLVTSIAPFFVDGDSQEIVYIHSGKLSTKEINLESCKTLRENQLQQFINGLSDGFYKPLKAAVLTMMKLKKSIKFN